MDLFSLFCYLFYDYFPANHYLKTCKVPVSNLILTESGRSQRAAGIKTLLESIEEKDWLGTPVIACLTPDVGAATVTQETAGSLRMLLVDGNHR